MPTCPEWTLFDLAQHLGEGRRAWAATVAAGPAASAKSASEGPAAPREREALPAWLAASTRQLLDALREAGPDRGLSTCCATTSAWPHKPAAVDFHAAEGRSWRLSLSADGARTARLPILGEDPDTADASVRGTAGELVLNFYGRIPIDSLQPDGDRLLFDQLIAWEPD